MADYLWMHAGELSGISLSGLWTDGKVNQRMRSELIDMLNTASQRQHPFVFFTEAIPDPEAEDDDDDDSSNNITVPKHYGEAFADHLRSLNLGPIKQFPHRLNGNSGNLVSLFVWTPDHPALSAYLQAIKPKEIW